MIQVKSYHVPAEQIERQLGQIEANLAQLEKEGVELEKNLRSCEEGADFRSLPGFLCSFGPADETQSSGARFDALSVPRAKFPGRFLLLLPCEQEAWSLCFQPHLALKYTSCTEMSINLCLLGGEGDILMDPLMVDWFNLIRKKQMYIRKESELVYL